MASERRSATRYKRRTGRAKAPRFRDSGTPTVRSDAPFVATDTDTAQDPAPAQRLDDPGALARVVDGRGHARCYALNGFHRIVQQIDELGRETLTERDPVNSNPLRTIRPNGSIVTRSFDGQGNVLSRSEEFNGATTTFSYGAFSLVRSVTNPNNHTTLTERDARGNVIARVDRKSVV